VHLNYSSDQFLPVDRHTLRKVMVTSKEIMTSKEVAQYLCIHTLTVHKYAREGKIPAFKIGTDWRFHKKSLEKWIDQKSTSNLGRNNRLEGKNIN